MRFSVCLLIGCAVAGMARAEIPPEPAAILNKYCLDCHDSDSEKSDVNLDAVEIDWTQATARDLWEHVLEASEDELMPPPDEPQPSAAERKVLFDWLDAKLLEHTPIGGTLARRLTQAEYQQTIQKLLGLKEFELPVGFPKDTEFHGFDNVGEGLLLSPPLMEAYANVAWEIADQIYPPAKNKTPESSTRTAKPEDMVISFSASSVRGDALRLASRHRNIMRSCTWPSRIEIKHSGVYRISVSGSTFKPVSDEPMKLELTAREVTASDRSSIEKFRVIQTIPFSKESPEKVTFEAELYEGQTVMMRWVNAEMTHDGEELEKLMKVKLAKNPRYLAAWQKAVFPHGKPKSPRVTTLRGANGWRIVKENMEDPDLDLSHATMDSEMTKALLRAFRNGMTNIADALCYDYFENGPSLELHEVTIEGPLKIVDGPKDLRRESLQEMLAGSKQGEFDNEDFARSALTHFLPRAFRKSVDSETVERYLDIAKEHWAAGHTFDEGMHLLLRNILISPRFLYRSLGTGTMDDHDLGTRLSYFLTQGPPDEKLIDLGNRNRLSPDWVLEREAGRLMPKRPTDPFVQSFTGQWLDTALLPEIMPDPKFNFTPFYIDHAQREVSYFFLEMLSKNRPMTDFIDPDFTWTSPLFAKNVYNLDIEHEKGKDRDFGRVELKRGGRAGGLLGQSAIMMATANGVDTQPVLRGVWMLENILGMPPPAPPKNVPALTPDTQGATTPRELLAAHTEDASCAICHEKIDPLGFVLENYDPVGRWRERWPQGNKKIDPTGVLPDGTPITNVVDLKLWMVENIDLFSQCLAEKLMTYATGRVPNYAERREIEAIVKKNHETGNGFRDLVLALIESQTFRTH